MKIEIAVISLVLALTGCAAFEPGRSRTKTESDNNSALVAALGHSAESLRPGMSGQEVINVYAQSGIQANSTGQVLLDSLRGSIEASQRGAEVSLNLCGTALTFKNGVLTSVNRK